MNRKQFRPPPAKIIQIMYAIGLGPLVGQMILLLTTTGRKSGLPRVTPLQYEEVGEAIYVASARGIQADWFKNILANPCVNVRYKNRQFPGIAQPVTDPVRIADFLELRIKRHPRMVGTILQSEGLPAKPNREQLEAYAKDLALVIIQPA